MQDIEEVKQVQENSEEGGIMDLSTGAQVGISAFFVALPLIAMGIQAMGMLTETSMVLSALGAGGLGAGAKFAIDRIKKKPAPGQASHATGQFEPFERVRSANWGALLGLPEPSPAPTKEREETGQGEARETGQGEARETAQDEPGDAQMLEMDEEQDPVFTQALMQQDVPGIPRITVEQIVAHTERNSYEVYIGRSMTRPNNPAVKIHFRNRHVKLIGATQHGKSSTAAALLEAILRTHDKWRVQVALLDLENKTSRLFANAPQIAKVKNHGRIIPLHARSYEQVLEHLGYISALIDFRYALSSGEVERLPVIIVYLEEFIDLKDYFKQRIDAVSEDEREQAKRDYAQLIFCIKKIARRGLKVLVQLLMCAQVDYRDEDLQEALVNVTSGMSFCVRVSAAQAAGFYQTELLKRNAREDKVGQAVVEMPDCKDLILAPEYDLKAKLRALPPVQRETEELPAQAETRHAPIQMPMPLPIRTEQKPQPTITDAITCWNELIEAGQNTSRNNLQKALEAKGFECRENWARKFYDDIREMLDREQSQAAVGE